MNDLNSRVSHDSISYYLQVKHAAEFGCVGMVLYSDPADYAVDSEVRVYPDDWWLPGTGVQRGTVLPRDGDPLTPYYPSIGE